MHNKMIALMASGIGLMNSTLPGQDMVLQGPDQRATLVELYSSEGCSSCPPAEKWISQLKNDPRLWKQIVPAVFHVDYWDGLGWPDRFARKAYTERQSDYAARFGSSSVYTPEFIVDAHEWHAWFDGGELPLSDSEASGPIRIVVSEDRSVKISHALIATTVAPHFTINVAWLGMNISSDVHGGENDGRQLVHDFVVLDFQSKTADFTVQNGISAEFPAPSLRSAEDHPAALAAWISRDDGTIFQAAGGWLK